MNRLPVSPRHEATYLAPGRRRECAEPAAVEVLDARQHAVGEGPGAKAAVVEARVGGRVRWGVGLAADVATASAQAVASVVHRVRGRGGARGDAAAAQRRGR